LFPSRDVGTGRTNYSAFARCYLNEAAVALARNPSYPGWAADGHLVVTPGNETDFDEIESDVRQLCSRFNVVSTVPGDDADLQPGHHRTGRSDASRQAAS
jgi:hypothetical protein